MIDIIKAVIIFMIAFLGGLLSFLFIKISEWNRLSKFQKIAVYTLFILAFLMCIWLSNYGVI